MAANMDIPLPTDSATLSPLPNVLRHGLLGVTILASLSFASSVTTMLYLSYKLVRWHFKTWSLHRRRGRHRREIDLNLGLEEQHFANSRSLPGAGTPVPQKRKALNQFLVLIFNLLIADVHQSLAFLLNGVWLSSDGIMVGTSTCWAQGWLISTGDLASSCFILLIAIHTYLAVVWTYKPSQWALYTAIGGMWTFIYVMAIIGVTSVHNGSGYGGYYVRAAAWCWINVRYETIRLVTHYLFIFIALALTSLLYTLVFWSLKLRQQAADQQPALPTPPRSKPGSKPGSVLEPSNASGGTLEASKAPASRPAQTKAVAHSGGRHPAFLVYPIIYVICTAPLALGRIATMAGADVALSYFCVAGALIASNGWLDVLVWGLTRHELLFSAEVDTEDVGLGTFNFMRTPPSRQYGNMVWVEGASRQAAEVDAQPSSSRRESSRGGVGGWLQERMGWRRLGRGSVGGGGGGSSRDEARRARLAGKTRSISQESLRERGMGPGDLAIQMDLVTTVVVEDADPIKQLESDSRSHYRRPSMASLSVSGSDKNFHTK